LVEQCQTIAANLGDPAKPLQAIASWVQQRAHRAAAGNKAD
jgi:hypothetical protein